MLAINPRQIDRCLVALESIADTLKKIEETITAPAVGEATQIIFFMEDVSGQKRKVDSVIQKITQLLKMSLAILDAKGNPAQVDGAPTWVVSDAALGTLVAAKDGMSAEFTPSGKLGQLKIQVLADADLGAGQKDLVGELDVTIVGAEAVTLSLSGVLEDLPVEVPVP